MTAPAIDAPYEDTKAAELRPVIIAAAIKQAAIEMILVGPRLREPQAEKIEALARSMEEIGLRTPVSVRLIADDPERPVYGLVAGYSRLLAAKRLGWDSILVDEQEFDNDEQAELWEIDENLMRGELSPAEEALHLARRKELFLILNNGTSCPENRQPGRPREFAADTAEKTGETKRDINRKIARANALGADLREVVGTSLDKGTELDALAEMQPEVRRRIIGEARRGVRVSAVREIKSDYDVLTEQKDALVRAWNRASPDARRWFRDYIDEPATGEA